MARKQGSDDLFRLITSLTLAEKSYFKKFAGRHGAKDSKYLQLFDTINAQEVFEEESLKKRFTAYASMKMYLFDIIMQSLLVSISDLDVQEELMRQMIYGKILQRKKLFGKSLQLIEKGLDTARARELFWLEEEFLRLRVNSAQFSWKADEIKRNHLKYLSDIQKAHDKQMNRERFMKERMKIYLIRKSQEYANRSIELTGEKVDLKFLKDASSALTPGNERSRLYVLYDYYMVHDDFENAYSISLKLMQAEKRLLDANKTSANLNSYLYALKLRINCCFDTGRIKEVGELLDKDWKALPGIEKDKPENFNFFMYMKSLYYWMSGKHIEGEQFIDSNIGKLMTTEYQEHYAEHIEVILPIKIVLEFSNGNDRRAVLSLNEYQRLNLKKSHTKYFKDCDLMRILIQVEMENYEVMETLIRNAIRKQRKLGMSALEMKFLNILKKVNSLNKSQIFTELSNLFKTSSEKVDILWIFYLGDWIESKKNSVALADILSARASQQPVAKGAK